MRRTFLAVGGGKEKIKNPSGNGNNYDSEK